VALAVVFAALGVGIIVFRQRIARAAWSGLRRGEDSQAGMRFQELGIAASGVFLLVFALAVIVP
jgi:hypothetical protein